MEAMRRIARMPAVAKAKPANWIKAINTVFASLECT